MAPFQCGHSVNQRGVARMLEVLPFPASKKKLCADCRTKTPADIFEILNKTNDARLNNNNNSSSNNNYLAPGSPTCSIASSRTAAPLTKEEGKESWQTHHLGEWARVAFLCVGDHDDDLKAMCDALRQKHGSGAEEEVLRALARAALRAYEVEQPAEPATHRIVAGLNDFIAAAAGRADAVRTFAQVRAVFASAKALRKLASEVSTGAAVLYGLFDGFERAASTTTAPGGAGARKGAVSRAGVRRVASGVSLGRVPPRTPRTPM
ncbi:uncharacterized protein PG986_010510 [Apiospora aurea]|uniref:Uncharacterized protein n=1 Tax=Apiospora aurea TaxID=335848 RepID=A0ABR1Q2G7_9PEZI